MRLIALLLICIAPIAVFSQRTVIHCGKLIDVEKGTVLTKQTIVVDGAKIVSVENGFTKPLSNDKLIDLSDKTVMPGLMDSHVHLESETSPNNYSQRFTRNVADIAFTSTIYARETLKAGFTSVRDLGGNGVNTSLRDAINSKVIVGPRVYSAGKSIATTGGHADPTNGVRKDLMGDPGPEAGVINGISDARKAVRQRYKEGVDVIKITASGGVLSVAKSGENPQFMQDELEEIIKTANDYGLKVAAHCHGTEAMLRAVRAGVHSIEHGTYMTPEVMDLMKQKGTYYVPTITAGKSVADSSKIPNYYPPLVQPKAATIGPKIQSTFAAAYKAGVKIAFGTDAGVYKHGKNWLEFVYMVEAGMPAMEAIQSATVEAAKLIGNWDELGSIKAGKIADIIAVEGDPIKDIQSMGKVKFVMKAGVQYF